MKISLVTGKSFGRMFVRIAIDSSDNGGLLGATARVSSGRSARVDLGSGVFADAGQILSVRGR